MVRSTINVTGGGAQAGMSELLSNIADVNTGVQPPGSGTVP
jgi:hypothetical protein